MARPKKKDEKDPIVEDGTTEEKTIPEKEPEPKKQAEIAEGDHGLPMKELFRIDEVAAYFGVTERCIRLWIDHGHLIREKVVGSIRISRASILRCRFRNSSN